MTDIEQLDGDVAELARRIAGIRFAMVTLPDADGRLRGRPLTVQDLDADGRLWFLVSRSSEWASGVGASGTQANVSFADPDDARWVSVSGTATLVDDRARIDEMWSALYSAWFDGKDDPDICVLRFDADVADYWDAAANKFVRMARILKAAVTGNGSDEGDRGTLHP